MGGSHRKVRRHGKIDHLPEDVRNEVERLLLEPDTTYEDIAEFLGKKGYDISRSAVGRYGKEFLNQVRELRVVEDQARTLVSEAGDGLILEEAASKLAAKSIVKLLLENGVQAARIPYLVSDLAKLQMSSVRREALKADLRKKLDRTFKKVEKDVKKMSKAEVLRFIKEEVYGLT